MTVHAEIKTETVEYKDGDTVLEGYLAYDAKMSAKRPGIVVIHNWMGVNAQAKKSAEDLAKMGYTALAADIYGKGQRPKDMKEAATFAGKYKGDRALLRRRVQAALAEVSKHKTVDAKRLGAMGYCFGGTTALELARSGADVKGVVSFHGGLDTPTPQDAKNIKGQVLAFHGADDPFVPAKDVAAFEDEMRAGGVQWELVKFAKAVHGFTDKDAGTDNSKGMAYNAIADKRSWQGMTAFWKEVFAR
jgi:dienelactone hydrolase